MNPTLFTVTIDTEEEWDWNAGWPTHGYSVRNIQHLPNWQALCARYNIATTYFTDLAVLDDPASCDVILQLAEQPRVEIGMHIHPWNTPPIDERSPSTARSSFIHNLRPDLIQAKLETVYRRFEKLGLHPTSFRGGRYSSGPVTQDFLRSHGFWADASVVPYTTWTDDGAPDYRDRDLKPRRVSQAAESHQKPSGGPGASNGTSPALWEIPLTLGFTRRPQSLWRTAYEFVENSWLGKLHLIGIWERLGIVRKSWLNFESPLGARMLSFLHILQRSHIPCVTFTVHSSSLIAGLNPFTPTAADQARLTDQAEGIFAMLAEWRDFKSATMTEVARTLEQSFTGPAAVEQ